MKEDEEGQSYEVESITTSFEALEKEIISLDQQIIKTYEDIYNAESLGKPIEGL